MRSVFTKCNSHLKGIIDAFLDETFQLLVSLFFLSGYNHRSWLGIKKKHFFTGGGGGGGKDDGSARCFRSQQGELSIVASESGAQCIMLN